jgi:hypothetical protein
MRSSSSVQARRPFSWWSLVSGGRAAAAAPIALLGVSVAMLLFARISTTGGIPSLVAGLFDTATQLGTSIGIAALTTIAAARTDAIDGDHREAASTALVEGFQTAYLAAAVLALAAAPAAAALLRRTTATTR